MTKAQLVQESGVPHTTLWRWTRAGLLPAPTRRGRQMIYPASALPLAIAIMETPQC